MKHAIEVNLNSFQYQNSDTPVLKDVVFTVDYGQVTLLSGLSGSGKSTLLSLMNGVIPRVIPGTLDGEVRLDGENIDGKSLSQISHKVGSVLQNAESQIVHQTVEDEIAFGCENFGMRPDRIEKEIEKRCETLGLGRTWRTRTLSGGQKQRVITASTLAMGTDILIFDEPLANLDQKGAVELLTLLHRLAKEGKAVLLVEHRLDVVLPYVDVIWQVKDQTVVAVSDKDRYLKSQINLISDMSEDYIKKEEPALQLKGVGKAFGERQILKQVEEEMKQGERILLLGENGCGKTTLMSIIARLLKLDEGEVVQYLDPSCRKKADKKWFQNVGVVYQNPNYQLFMSSVRDEITFGTKDEAYAMRMAEYFDLTALLDRHPHSLSEGQKRRVTIAAILAQRPKLLLLDEPTVGQDYNGLKRMVAVLNQIHREEQNTMITITHDFRCAKALCDRALWLENGNIIKSGKKELVDEYMMRQNHQHEKAALLSSQSA